MSQDPWYQGEEGEALELTDQLVNGNLSYVCKQIVDHDQPAVIMAQVWEMIIGPGERATLKRGVQRAYERKD